MLKLWSLLKPCSVKYAWNVSINSNKVYTSQKQNNGRLNWFGLGGFKAQILPASLLTSCPAAQRRAETNIWVYNQGICSLKPINNGFKHEYTFKFKERQNVPKLFSEERKRGAQTHTKSSTSPVSSAGTAAASSSFSSAFRNYRHLGFS